MVTSPATSAESTGAIRKQTVPPVKPAVKENEAKANLKKNNKVLNEAQEIKINSKKIKQQANEIVQKAQESVKDFFEYIDEVAEFNQEKVLKEYLSLTDMNKKIISLLVMANDKMIIRNIFIHAS